MSVSTEETHWDQNLSQMTNTIYFTDRAQYRLPPTANTAFAATNRQENLSNNTQEGAVLGNSRIHQASASTTRGHRARVSFAEPSLNHPVMSFQEEGTVETNFSDEPPDVGTHSIVRRSLSLLKRIVPPMPSATAMCEGSCAIHSFPPAMLRCYDDHEMAKGAILPTIALFLPLTLPTHQTTSRKIGPIPIKTMDPSRESSSRGSLSKFFKRGGSDLSQSTSVGSGDGSKTLRSIFTRDSTTSMHNSCGNSPTTPSPASPVFPFSASISEIVLRPPPSFNMPEVSVWEDDTESDGGPKRLRRKIRAQVMKLKRGGSSFESGLKQQRCELEEQMGDELELTEEEKEETEEVIEEGREEEIGRDAGTEVETETETETEKENVRISERTRELKVMTEIPLPSRVYGKKIAYESTDQSEADLGSGTFSHFPTLPRHYVPPAANEVLHIRESGYEYLTLERVKGTVSITAGTLQCFIAELAHPLFDENNSSLLWETLIFCGNMLFGNEKLLEMLFLQTKNSAEKPEQQLNIVHFLMHWINEKPEDFSWGKGMMEFCQQFFQHLLVKFQQTELAANILSLSIDQQRLEGLYDDFVAEQKKGWIPFDELVMAYRRDTDCDLVITGLSEIDADDLTHYMAAVDLVLFRDGSEMSTLDQYWREKARQESTQYFADRSLPWWWPVERVERILMRIKMIKHWVALEILQLSTHKSRSLMIQVFVTAAENLQEMGDFHGAYCIMQGLEHPLVRLLERSWEDIGLRCFRRYKKLRKFFYERKEYDACVNAPSQDPVIPYYGYFIEDATKIRHEKDHSSRVRTTGELYLHRDALLGGFGTWDTPGGEAPKTVSSDGVSQVPASVDLKKYRSLLEWVQGHQDRAKPDYWFSGEINRESFILRLHLLGMNSFFALWKLEDSAATGRGGRLNFTSRLVETRMLEAWALVPKLPGPIVWLDKEDTVRAIVLQRLHMATGE